MYGIPSSGNARVTQLISTAMELQLIEVDHHALTARFSLAGENETCLYFARLKGIIHFHMHFSFVKMGAARAAHSSFA